MIMKDLDNNTFQVEISLKVSLSFSLSLSLSVSCYLTREAQSIFKNVHITPLVIVTIPLPRTSWMRCQFVPSSGKTKYSSIESAIRWTYRSRFHISRICVCRAELLC